MTQVELNYYTTKDSDLWLYVLEGDGILNLFKDYQNALNYAKDRNYDLIDHCN